MEWLEADDYDPGYQNLSIPEKAETFTKNNMDEIEHEEIILNHKNEKDKKEFHKLTVMRNYIKNVLDEV
jgi:hypothetical protein